MRQVLFTIPFTNIPIYGYGMMLFLACASCPAIPFPLPSAPAADMARLGYQHAAGFGVYSTDLVVYAVEPGSPADEEGLKPGDRIVKVNGTEIKGQGAFSPYEQFATALLSGCPSGQHDFHLVVRRGAQDIALAFALRSLHPHPPQ